MSQKVSYKWFRRTQYIPRFGGFYKEVGRLWKESAPELMGVKLFLELVRLVLLKKYGSKFIIVPVWDSFLSVYHKFGSSNTWELSKSK